MMLWWWGVMEVRVMVMVVGQLRLIMMLASRLAWWVGHDKVYYPFFLAADYTPLEYSPYYAQRAAKLRIDRPNMYQTDFTYLPKFLSGQIEEDKTLFKKEKEFLFVGRSNAGKSSLINAIFNTSRKATKKRVARVSKAGGTTKFLHFHHIENEGALIVDAPGYGFARMNKKRRDLWFGLTDEYMKISSRLSQIFVCVNFEHGLKEADVQFLQRASKYNVDVQVVMTKVDKVPPRKYYYQLQAIVEALKRLQLPNLNQRMLAVSCRTNFGVEVMRMRLVEAIEQSRQRDIDRKEDLLLSYLKELRVQRTRIEEKQPAQSKEFLVRKLIYNSKLTKYLK